MAICSIDGTPRWHPIWYGNPILATPAHIAAGHVVQKLINAPGARPYIIYPFTEQTGWTFNKAFRASENVAKIYLTEEEANVGLRIRERLGPYVLIEPYTKHINLEWPLSYWAELVGSRPDLTFVQHTHQHSELIPGAYLMPATFREACGLVAASELYVRSESGMIHAAAALGAKTVAIWGGCMDWDVLGNYPGEHGIVDHGSESPCGRWFRCEHCREVMGLILPEIVSSAIDTQLRARAA